MKQKDRTELMNKMTYIELTEVVTNGQRALKQIGILKAEKMEILRNIMTAQVALKKYKDVPNPASGNFN